jgi:nitroreductase
MDKHFNMQFIKNIYHLIPAPLREKRHTVKNWIKSYLDLPKNYLHDAVLFASHSSAFKSKGNRDNQKAELTFHYHKIEKAMALAHPRSGFGSDWIAADFIPLLKSYYKEYGYDEVVGSCCQNLKAYTAFNRKLGAQLPEIYEAIEQALSDVRNPHDDVVGGVKQVSSENLKAGALIEFEKFVNTRHSIRNFTDEPVTKNLVEKAIGIAQRTPSVCNRQPWSVYGFSEKNGITNALKLQNGNAGFAENIQILLVVAGDLSAMMSSSERNEIWIDGGMFSMSLVYALHSLGLGTCCLNLCYNVSDETQLRQLVKMAPHHRPVMMIAIGHIPDALFVAHSHRKSVNDVLTWR